MSDVGVSSLLAKLSRNFDSSRGVCDSRGCGTGRRPQTADGPNFKYEEVNTGNLHLTGKQPPATVAVGDTFRFVAEVIEFNTVQCVFRLAPVSTETR
ncbi:DUF4839 domain-containing protein [Streptomyces rubiginosohelvolus]|uniref:DUF4839 domain-containing protein n=1 Tax=Streptomyces rubiginosohelvolus TaxID=67362 RepID=UPI0033A9A2D3